MTPLENVTIKDQWLDRPSLQKLFDILCANGGQIMVAGGAVRNSLLGEAVADIDLCTTLLPSEIVEHLEAADQKAVPTGIEHGTITAVIDGDPYEVTTLREDIETDGRHAVVRFGTNWQADACRRDLTINALYCDREGRVFDFVDGYADILHRNVRFIGNAEERIREDALRILRFFRFFAWYGSGRPDAQGLKACSASKELLSGLSVERIWMELKKLLTAPDPGRALLWMRTTGILSALLPETEKWGIDAVPGLVQLEAEQKRVPDALLRLMAMIRPEESNVQVLAKRLLLSNAERERLEDWANSSAPAPSVEVTELEKLLYRGSQTGLCDAMLFEVVHLRNREDDAGAGAMLDNLGHAKSWKKPVFPVQGKDLLEKGFEPGPEVGKKLSELEEIWVEGGFNASRDELIDDLVS